MGLFQLLSHKVNSIIPLWLETIRRATTNLQAQILCNGNNSKLVQIRLSRRKTLSPKRAHLHSSKHHHPGRISLDSSTRKTTSNHWEPETISCFLPIYASFFSKGSAIGPTWVYLRIDVPSLVCGRLAHCHDFPPSARTERRIIPLATQNRPLR